MTEGASLPSGAATSQEALNIRVVNVLFDDRLGGPPKRAVMVARRLASEGIRTLICVPDGSGNVVDLARDAGVASRRVRFQRMPRTRDLWGFVRWFFWLPRDVSRFLSAFRDEGPTLVHVNGAFFVAPAVAAKILGLPLVWHLNDTSVSKFFAPVLGFVVRLLADRVLVAAEAVARHYAVAGIEHDVIYAPVEVAQFQFRSTDQEDTLQRAKRLGLIANWNPTKGIEHFVRACALLRRSFAPHLEIVFAGAKLATQSEYCRRIDDLIDTLGLRAAVRHLGFVSDIPHVMSEIDVLVLSSTAEACPMVVLEAMAAGVSVVATDVGGVRELLQPGTIDEAGVVVPAKNPEAIARGVRTVLESPTMARRLARNGRRLARERFSLESCVEKHIKVYAGLLPRH